VAQAVDKAKTKKLTEKQRRFVEEYLIDLNGTQAVIRAGFSEKGADVAASRLLGNVRVQAAVSEGKRNRSRRVEITQARVLEEIAHIALSDLSEAFERDGKEGNTLRLRRLTDMPEGVRRSIESIREQPTDKGVMRSVKLHSKVAALKMLADHLGLEAPKKHLLAGDQDKPIAIKGVNSLTREQTIAITSKILGVAQKLVERKFVGSASEEQAKDE